MEDRTEKFLMKKIEDLESDVENKYVHHKVKIERLHNNLFGDNGIAFKVDRLEQKANHSREVWYIIVTLISIGISVLSLLK